MPNLKEYKKKGVLALKSPEQRKVNKQKKKRIRYLCLAS